MADSPDRASTIRRLPESDAVAAATPGLAGTWQAGGQPFFWKAIQ